MSKQTGLKISPSTATVLRFYNDRILNPRSFNSVPISPTTSKRPSRVQQFGQSTASSTRRRDRHKVGIVGILLRAFRCVLCLQMDTDLWRHYIAA